MHEFKFEIHDAVWYGDRVGRVEDRAIDGNEREIYLIQLSDHRYRWVGVEDLEVYIG